MIELIVGFRLIDAFPRHEEYLPEIAQSKSKIEEVIYNFKFDKGTIIAESPCVIIDYKGNNITEKELIGYTIESVEYFYDLPLTGVQITFENGSQVFIQGRYADNLYYIDNTSTFFSTALKIAGEDEVHFL